MKQNIIFKFLQTHFPQKKYDLVIEIEKQKISNMILLENKSDQNIPLGNNQDNVSSKAVIKQRLVDLKEFFDDGLITEDEYNTRKKEILMEI